VQRFGSALNLNVHLHLVVLDGVYVERADGSLRWHRVQAPTTAEVERLLERVGRRVEAWLARRAGRRVPRVQVLGGQVFGLPPRCAAYDGYNLHGGVAVGARDRRGLERLCRYVLRPAVPLGRLEERSDGTVALKLRRPSHRRSAPGRLPRPRRPHPLRPRTSGSSRTNRLKLHALVCRTEGSTRVRLRHPGLHAEPVYPTLASPRVPPG